MTHGSIRLEQGDHFVHLHTTHDGHFSERLETVLYLPHALFLEAHRRRYWPLEHLMQHDGFHDDEHDKGDPKDPDFDRVYKRLRRMARSFTADLQSVTEYLTRVRMGYLFPLPKTSAEQGTLDYWNYGSEKVMTVRCDEPETNHIVLDVGPEIRRRETEEREEVLSDIGDKVEKINNQLEADYYQKSNGAVIIPVKKTIAKLITMRLAGDLFVPECRWMKFGWDDHFFDGNKLDHSVTPLP